MTATPRLWTDEQIVAYVARAEVRAITLQDSRAPDLEDTTAAAVCTYTVETKGDDGTLHHVAAFVDPDHPGAPVVIRCTCPSGIYRGDVLAVPCWHAAAVGRQLEADGHTRRAAYGWVTAGEDTCPGCGAGTPAGALDYAHTPGCPDYVSDADLFDL